ncbi:hypothetical protein ACQW5G_05630 [Fructilactobacillus sp. Tb1]|uniref:hypothetical protein n=1 Tax=Fructilactobacillus sp. Tb1 TaxID=3422304 RepID=UPI003D290762
MKKWMSGMIILVVFILIGSVVFINHESKAKKYHTNIEKGHNALNKKQYDKAQKHFKNALDTNPSSNDASQLSNQVSNYIDGENGLNSNDFDTAKNNFEKVTKITNASDVLVNRSNEKIKLVNEINNSINNYNQIYSVAVAQHNAKNYTASNATLNQILDDNKINEKYYSDILAKAQDLRKSNLAMLNSDDENGNESKTANNSEGNEQSKSKSDASSTDNNASTPATSNNSTVTTKNDDSLNAYTNPSEYQNRFN